MEKNEQKKIDRIRQKIKTFPDTAGLYFFKTGTDKVLYIGKAKNLRSRVNSYFQSSADLASTRGPKIVEMIKKAHTVDYLETQNEVDAILKEARLIKDIRPQYNTDMVDDKSFPYLEIKTGDDFPGVYITRKPAKTRTRLFGPFTGTKNLREALVVLQRIFKFRTCVLDIKNKDPKRRFFRPCLLYSIKQCSAPCAERISRPDYKKIISDLVKFLSSKRAAVLRQLKKQMTLAAKNLEYEKASVLRDRIRLIQKLDQRGTPDQNVQPEVFAQDPQQALIKLQKLLKTEKSIRIIEGIDIAHISGSDAVGSLVKFIDGKPFKAGYRRFKIKTVEGIDDYAMIAEVVKRRYKYALAGEELWPDLILIDGGIGQLHAAQNALKKLNAQHVAIVSIAKKQEEIFTQSSPIPLRLPSNNSAKKLLQYVRDESHRFAQHYHHILRNKKL